MRPAHETVQASERGDALGAGPQHQMVGVAQQDVGAGRPHRLGREPLHGGLSADRHEGGRRHRPMRGRDLAPAGGTVGRQELEREGGH